MTRTRRSRSRWVALAGAGAAALLAGCGAAAPAETTPGASAVVADEPRPVLTPAEEQVDGTGPFAPSTGSGGPCDTNAVMDLVGDAPGEASAGGALARWLDGPRGHPAVDVGAVPEGVPADGWVAGPAPAGGPAGHGQREQVFTSGGWRVSAVQASNGTWLVTRFGCTTG